MEPTFHISYVKCDNQIDTLICVRCLTEAIFFRQSNSEAAFFLRPLLGQTWSLSQTLRGPVGLFWTQEGDISVI